MSVVLRSPCPACRKPLNIPADWVGQALRCKHCGNYLASRRKPKAAPMPQAAPQAAPLPHVAPLPTPHAAPNPIWEPLPDYTPPMPMAPTGMPAPMVAPMPTSYPQAGYPQAAPVASGYVSAFDTRDRYAGKGNYRGPKKKAWLKPVVFGLFIVALLSGAGIIYKLNPGLFSASNDDPQVANSDKKDGDKKENPGTTAKTGDVTGAFPRRMLAISVHEYLYANSLNKGSPHFSTDSNSSNTDTCIRRLADRWRVPNEQFYHLTDMDVVERKRDPKKAGRSVPVVSTAKYLPMKNVMEGAITSFLESSRDQDRIVLMYCGHAIEKNGEVYLTPMEGDFEELETLVPLKKIYEQLAACKAQEKLVVFDVCRFDVERGADRPHAGPMSEALEKGLHDAPEGVSVLTSCSKGEHSYEQDYAYAEKKYQLHGSFFLSQIDYASGAGYLVADTKKLPAPSDEMPVERLLAYQMDHLPKASQQYSGKMQTPKLTLKRKADAVAYNPSEAQPARFEYPAPPPSADPKSIRELLEEILLPPVKQARQDAGGIPVNLPFRKEVLAEYLDDKQTPTEGFKKVVVGAVDKMRELREAGGGKELREEFSAETSDAAKKLLQEDQKTPALVEAELREQYDALKEIGKDRDKQPKRWQAHYDYVYSQVLYRICYVNQYNLALANVRTGKIPDLDPEKKQNGYRLTAEATLDKTTVKEYKQWYDEAKKISNDLAKTYAGTPWSLLGKSDRSLNLGLRVSPATSKFASN